MKKLFVLLLLLSLTTVVVFSQDAELGYREAGLSRAMLYPEGNFFNWPSRLNLLEKQLLKTKLRLEMNPGAANKTITSDQGTLKTNFTDYQLELDGSYFFRMEDMVLGVRVDDNIDMQTVTDSMDDGYTTAGDTLKIYEKNDNYFISPELFFAMPFDNLNFGVRVDYNMTLNPAKDEFEQTTDSTLNGGAMYFSDGIGAQRTDDSNHTITVLAGVDGESDGIEWGASLGGHYYWRDEVVYYAIDSDNDGTYADLIVDEVTAMNTPVAEGGAGFTGATAKHLATNLWASIRGYGILPVNDKGKVIVSATWRPYDVYSWEDYTRTTATDKSTSTEEIGYGLTNFDLGAAYAMELGEKWSLRAGTGFNFQMNSYKYNNVAADGTSGSSAANTSHFNESGAAITEDLVWNNGSLSDYFRYYIPLEAEVRFKPADTVTLFSTFSSRFQTTTETKSLFSTIDDTVWTESETNYNNWANTNLVGGIDVALTDTLNVLFTANYWPQPFRLASTGDSETLPKGSSTVTGDTETNDDTEIDVQLNFVFRY